MEDLLTTKETVLQKLKEQTVPRMLFADVDGTLFSPDLSLITAPLINRKLAQLLNERHIPLVLVTGRSDWADIDRMHLKLLGLGSPDMVITANGTIIYKQRVNGLYARDLPWEHTMQYAKVTWENGKQEAWNKLEILTAIKAYLQEKTIPFRLGVGNTFLIRISFRQLPVSLLQTIKTAITQLFPKGVRVVFTESLLKPNSTTVFSGDMLLTPTEAGKEEAVSYVLKTYAQQLKKKIHADIFGDATVDVGMLTMNAHQTYYSLSQYLVHPTPLARLAIEQALKRNEHLHILEANGPEEILQIISLCSETKENLFAQITKDHALQPKILQKPLQLSKAQNNPIRQVLRLAEPLLNKLVDEKLSPNEVSFLGLSKLSQGIEEIYSPTTSLPKKILGLYHYGFGNLTDVLDGIRARHSDKREENGQLVDGFSDRAKEFMQLFTRAKRRITVDEIQGIETLMTALSCALPSIARAQVEIFGKTVPEKDEKGGSMIDRTKKLFTSLLLDTIGTHNKSLAIDEEIYSTNIATYEHRLSFIKKTSMPTILEGKIILSTEFEKKALERWLLYIDVLQQEDKIIQKYLSKHPRLFKEYERQSQKLAKNYLALPINTLRKRWDITDYKLRVDKYL